MDDSQLAERARIVLRQAQELRQQVREGIAHSRFGNDDVLMKAYNDIAGTVASLFPDDPVLHGQLVLMPDATLQGMGVYFKPDVPSMRLETHLTRIVNRLEVILGEPTPPDAERRRAKEVLQAEREGDARSIFDGLEDLRRKQPELPPVDVREFDFIVEPSLRPVLASDFIEAQRAFAVGAFKASSVLAGGLVEGMLFDVLRRPEVVSMDSYQEAIAKFPKVKDKVNWDKVSLTQLISAAALLGFLDAPTSRLTEGARDFRDTVHPNAEIRIKARAGREEAELLMALVKLIYRRLSTIGNGPRPAGSADVSGH